MKVGFIGLGNVGSKLAGSLLRNKFDLTVRDLEENITSDFINKGAKTANSAKELAELVEVIKENNVKAIFGDVASSDVLAQTLAAEVGDMKVVPLFTESLGATDTDAATYLGMLRANGKLISDSLSG